jgi:hypothetical protein
MDTVRYRPDDRGPQDARSVLRRRAGRCSGLANASAALLRAAGFEARTVSGLLMADGSAIPHRWLECRLPDAGWVGCDPTLGLWVMTTSHLAFGRTVERLPTIERVAGGDPDLAVLPRRGRWPVRPNRGASLTCRVRSPVDGAAIRLLGPWNEERRSEIETEAGFAGLLPGRWQLEVLVGDRVVERLRLRLEGDRPHTVLVDPATAGRPLANRID